MSLFEDASLIITPNGRKAGKIYALKPFNGSGDLTVVRATTATEVNSSGVIVDVASNVARFDYTNGSCPSILVEPQRTNIALYSEQFDNAYWSKTRSTITANATTSPKSDVTADKLIETAVAGSHFVERTYTTVASTIYTYSIFVKKAEREWCLIECLTTGKAIFVNLNDGSLGTRIGYLVSDIDVKLFADGWFRISVKDISPSTILRYLNTIAISSSSVSYTGNGTSGIYIWGAQLESGSNATSYIPTTTSAVTRNADVISKSGISSLIGQTDGTIFADVNFNNSASKIEVNRIIELTDGTNTNRIIIAFGSGNTLLTRVTANNIEQASFQATSISLGRLKVALSYSTSGVRFFVNGTLRQSNLSATIPITNRLNIGYQGTSTGSFLNDTINSALIFPTALTDEQCINLTSI